MANDFTGDSNCVALWRFENGALTTDSIGTNTLTDNNTVGTETTDYKEGSACADLETDNSEYFSIADADLDADFPLKSGDTNKKISVCGWFKCESLGTGDGIVVKYDINDNKRSFAFFIGSYFYFRIGYNNGEDFEDLYVAGAPQINRWYHFGVTFDNSDKSWKLVIWDDSTENKVIDTSGTATNNINVEDANFEIGAYHTYDKLDGLIDEVVVFKDILTADEIDEIRGGTYSESISSSSSSSFSLSSSSSSSSFSLSSSSSSSSSSSISSSSSSFSLSSSSSSSSSFSSSSSSRSSSSSSWSSFSLSYSSSSRSSSSSSSLSSSSSSSLSSSSSSSFSSFSLSFSSSSSSSSSRSSSSSSFSSSSSSSSSVSSSSSSRSSSSSSFSSSSSNSSSSFSSSSSSSKSSSSSSKSIFLRKAGIIKLDVEVISSSTIWGYAKDWRGHIVRKQCTIVASSLDGTEVYGETLSNPITGYFNFKIGVGQGQSVLLTSYYEGSFRGQINIAEGQIFTTGSSSSSSSISFSSSSVSSSSKSSSSISSSSSSSLSSSLSSSSSSSSLSSSSSSSSSFSKSSSSSSLSLSSSSSSSLSSSSSSRSSYLSSSSSSRSSSSISPSFSSSSRSSSSSSVSFSSSSRSSSSRSSSSVSSSSSSSSLSSSSSSSSSSFSFSSSSKSSSSSSSIESISSSSSSSLSSYSSSSSSSRSSSSRSSSSVSHSLSSSSLSSSSSSSISFSSSSRSSSSSSYSISSSSSSSSSSSYASVALEYYETASSGLKKLDDTNPTSSTLDTESSFANGIYYDVGWEDSRWEEDNAYGIDLGESKDVDTLRIYINLEGSPHDLFGTYDAWDPDENGTLSAYYSNDNSSWTLISSKDCNSENFPLRQYNVEGVASFDFIFSSTISARYFKLVNTGSYELKFMDSGSFLSCSARCAGEIVAGYKTSPSEAPGALDEFSTVKWDADFGMEDVRFYPEHEYKTVTIGEE